MSFLHQPSSFSLMIFARVTEDHFSNARLSLDLTDAIDGEGNDDGPVAKDR